MPIPPPSLVCVCAVACRVRALARVLCSRVCRASRCRSRSCVMLVRSCDDTEPTATTPETAANYPRQTEIALKRMKLSRLDNCPQRTIDVVSGQINGVNRLVSAYDDVLMC